MQMLSTYCLNKNNKQQVYKYVLFLLKKLKHVSINYKFNIMYVYAYCNKR